MSERATDELFGGDEPQVSEPAATPVAEPAAAPVEHASVVEPANEPAAAPAPQSDPLQADRDRDLAGLIKALQDEREQKRAAKEEAAALRAWRDELERKRQQASQQRPHVLDDPDGFVADLEKSFHTTLQTTLMRERIEASTDKWTEKLGEEQFKALYQWTATMPPAWVKWAESQRDPFGVAHKEFEKQQKAKRADELAAKLGDKDLDAYLEEKLAERLAQQQAAQPAAQPAVQPERVRAPNGQFASTPPEQQRHRPESLAAVNGASVADVGTGSGSALDGLFN